MVFFGILLMLFLAVCCLVGFVKIMIWVINGLIALFSSPTPAPPPEPMVPDVQAVELHDTAPPVTPRAAEPVLSSDTPFAFSLPPETDDARYQRIRRLAEVLTRNALNAGIVCAGVAAFGALYHYRAMLSGPLKLALLFTCMCAVYLLGRWLYTRRGYPRTGLALMGISAVWLPLNYYAAILFKVLEVRTHPALAWCGVFTVCALIYMAMARQLHARIFAALALLAWLAAVACGLWDATHARAVWQIVFGGLAFGLLGLSTLRWSGARSYRLAAVWLALLVGCGAFAVSCVPFGGVPAEYRSEELWFRCALLALFLHGFTVRIARGWAALATAGALVCATGMLNDAWGQSLNILPWALMAGLLLLLHLTAPRRSPTARMVHLTGFVASLLLCGLLGVIVCARGSIWGGNILALALCVGLCAGSHVMWRASIALAGAWGFAFLLVLAGARSYGDTWDQTIWLITLGLAALSGLNALLPKYWRGGTPMQALWLASGATAAAYLLVLACLPHLPQYAPHSAVSCCLLWFLLLVTYRDSITAIGLSSAAQLLWLVVVLAYMRHAAPGLLRISIVCAALGMLTATVVSWIDRTRLPRILTHHLNLLFNLADSLLVMLLAGTFVYAVQCTSLRTLALMEAGLLLPFGVCWLGLFVLGMRRHPDDTRAILGSLASLVFYYLAVTCLLRTQFAGLTPFVFYNAVVLSAGACLVAVVFWHSRWRRQAWIYHLVALLPLVFCCCYAFKHWTPLWQVCLLLWLAHTLLAGVTRTTLATIQAQAATILCALTLGYLWRPDILGFAHGLLLCGAALGALALLFSFFERAALARLHGTIAVLAWVTAYFLYLRGYHVDELAAWLWLPAALIIVITDLARRHDALTLAARNAIQLLGLLLYFGPTYLNVVHDRALADHVIVLLSASVLCAAAMGRRNRFLFHAALAIICVDVVTLVIQVVRFGQVPWFVPVALAACLLIGIGLLFEKNLNLLIKQRMHSLRAAYSAFFDSWE